MKSDNSLILKRSRWVEGASSRKNWVLRFGVAILFFAATIGLSLLLNYYSTKINLTIPVVFALVATIWIGGRGPGLLLSVMFEATTIIYTPIPPDSNIAKAIFGYFSVFSLYVFLVLVISGLKNAQYRLKAQRDLLQVTLSSIGDAVIATDREGIITFINPAASRLTGWKYNEARGLPLEKIFNIVNEETGQTVENPVNKVLEQGAVVGLANHTLLITKNGDRIPIDDSAAPIIDEGQIKGVVLVFADVTERKLAERARRETEIMHRIVEAQEAERRRIARDLHDHLGQKMTALRLRIEGLNDTTGTDPTINHAIRELQASALNIDRDIGYLSWELRPTELENLGLNDALGSFVREWSMQHGIPAEFQTTRLDSNNNHSRLAESVETNLYRIVQEALNNVVKHANAESVSVLLQHASDRVVLIIEDNGHGFEPEANGQNGSKPGGLGLIGMQERAALLNGTLEIDTSSGMGTTILAQIPLNAPNSNPEYN